MRQGPGAKPPAISTFVLLTLLVCPSCETLDDPARRPIQGTVTVDGEPLEIGTILFIPDKDARPSTLAGADVVNGQFSIAREVGPVPGNYSVSISSIRPAPAPAKPPDPERGGSNLVELLPPKYNSETELRVRVTPRDESFGFDLSLKE